MNSCIDLHSNMYQYCKNSFLSKNFTKLAFHILPTPLKLSLCSVRHLAAQRALNNPFCPAIIVTPKLNTTTITIKKLFKTSMIYSSNATPFTTHFQYTL